MKKQSSCPEVQQIPVIPNNFSFFKEHMSTKDAWRTETPVSEALHSKHLMEVICLRCEEEIDDGDSVTIECILETPFEPSCELDDMAYEGDDPE